MKAIVKYGEAPGQVDYREIPEPQCGYRDVKIAVKACAICVTDLHIMAGTYPWQVGTPLGHEFCGIITEVGVGVRRFRVGDRVTACMNGGFAPFVIKDEDDWVFHLPDELSFHEGALLEPAAAAVNSVVNRSHILPGDPVLIEGPGVIGLLALQAARLQGAHVIISGTNKDEQRLCMAKKLGAERTVNVQQEDLYQACNDFSNGAGMSTVLECSGSQEALDAGLRTLCYDGQLTQVGIFAKQATVDLSELVYNNRKIIGSIAYDRATWIRVIELVRTHQLDVKALVSHVLPITEWEKGFELARRCIGFRVILIPE